MEDVVEEKPLSENPASLYEDIVSLRSLFQDIANHTGLLLPYDNGLLHCFGKSNIEEAKHNFEKIIQHMRAVYTQWKTQISVAENQNIPRYLSRLNDRVAETTSLESLQKDLQKCCQLAEQHLLNSGNSLFSDKSTSGSQSQLVIWVESIAKKIGLSCEKNWSAVEDMEDNDNTISLYGQTMLVIDIVLQGDDVKEVKVTTGDATTYTAHQLCDMLRKRKIDEFTETVKWMTRSETLLQLENLPSTVITVLETDLLKAHSTEMGRFTEKKVLRHKHGVIERLAECLQITYYASSFYFLRSPEEQLQIRHSHRFAPPNVEVYRAFVTLQRIPWTNPLIPNISQINPDDLKKIWAPPPDDPESANQEGNFFERCISFSLELSPAIPMATHFSLLTEISASPPPKFSQKSKKAHATLLSLLTNKHKSIHEPQTPREFHVNIFDSNMKFVFTGEDSKAIQLCKIPFTHPIFLRKLLNPIRQQIVFNELLTSCIKPTSAIPNQDSFESTVFEVVNEAPFWISVLFLHSTSYSFISMKIQVESGGRTKTTLSEPLSHLSEYVSKLIKKSHHIPLTLYNLLQIVDK